MYLDTNEFNQKLSAWTDKNIPCGLMCLNIWVLGFQLVLLLKVLKPLGGRGRRGGEEEVEEEEVEEVALRMDLQVSSSPIFCSRVSPPPSLFLPFPLYVCV